YYTTSTPMVRMNFNPVVGVNEVENTYALSVYPNPANTNATVSFSLNNEAAVSINVTDLSGKVVYMNTLGTVNGTQSVNVTTDALKSGVYMVNVTVDGNVSTQKLVIRK
ncbi:MAG: T9SS type A sorting domain-containing protein, partial [Flavobacteriia bacterium]